MKIKRFFDVDMHQTMQQVRNELGPEAVILSRREVNGGIEIICAIDIDYDQNLKIDGIQAAEKTQEDSRSGKRGTDKDVPVVTARHTEGVPAASSGGELPQQGAETPTDLKSPNKLSPEALTLQELKRELASMKGLLNNQLSQSSWEDDAQKRPLIWAQHIRRLKKLGLTPKIACKIADSVHETKDEAKSWREVLYRVAEHIPVVEDDIMSNGGIVMLVGPTGVGKTTTVAKLATRFALKNGCDQVALVTTDTVGVGEEKQLQTYGQLLGVPVFMASKDELNVVLEGLSEKKLILIDSAGINPLDPHICQQFQTLSNAFPVKIYLAMSANTQRTALDEVVRAFGLVGLKGCVVTKVDEALSIGDVLSVVIRHRLPLAYVSDGRRIPEDLHPARTTDLVARALSLVRRGEKTALEEPTSVSMIGQTPKNPQDEIWYLSPSPVDSQSSKAPILSHSQHTVKQKKRKPG